MEQQLPTKQFKSDDAREYADLLSVFNDLNFVLYATDRLLQELAKPDHQRDAVALRAYWSAATVAYIRCFGSGKRHGLKPTIFDSLDDTAAAHQHIKDTRDKHVAHSVNAFEEVKVGFVLGAAPTASAEGVAHLSMFRMCDNESGVRNLQILAQHALAAVRPRIETLKNALLVVGQKMRRSELDKLPNLGIRVKDKPGRPRQ
jgi:hypothetical protein